MSKPKKRTGGKKPHVDSGYPFDTGDWAKWSNRKRLEWLTNLRDKSRDKFKQTLNISDEDIAEMSANVEAMEKVVLNEEYVAAQKAARNAPTPRESARMLGELIDDICANDYFKAMQLGLTDEQIDKMRADADKYVREVEEWERRENAKKILGFAPPARNVEKNPDDLAADPEKQSILEAFGDIDISALKAAHASGDEEAAHREFKALTGQLEAKADKDPVFAKWFEEFCAEQERLLRWDDTIGDDNED